MGARDSEPKRSSAAIVCHSIYMVKQIAPMCFIVVLFEDIARSSNIRVSESIPYF